MKIKYCLFVILLTLSSVGCTRDDNVPLTEKQLIGAVLNDMIFVKGGSFLMGDPRHRHNYPEATVSLSGYYLDRFATPWYQYKRYLTLTGQKYPLYHSDKLPINKGLYPASDTYSQAFAFCRWIGKKTNLPVTLVTEAQWEYAARSRGATVSYATNNGKLEPGVNFPNIAAYTFYYKGRNGGASEVKVNRFPPNPLGFYLMSGNGMEWVSDHFGSLPQKAVKDPQGAVIGKYRTDRGSSVEDIIAGLDKREQAWSRKWHLDTAKLYARFFASEAMHFNFRCAINTSKPLPKM